MNAIEIEIKRSERTGKSRVKVVMGDLWATYNFDYSVIDSNIPLFYATKFADAVNERPENFKIDVAKMIPATTRNGWVVVLG